MSVLATVSVILSSLGLTALLADTSKASDGDWEISLQGRTSTGELVHLVTYSDNILEIGHYEFRDIEPGTYWLNCTYRSGFYSTTPLDNFLEFEDGASEPVELRIDFRKLLPGPDPEIGFVLKKGANLWSTPLVNTGVESASDLATLIGPTCSKISMFDTATGKYKSFIPALHDAGSGNDFAIDAGKGYFVYVTSETVFSMVGELPATSTVGLAKGVNIVGYNSLTPTTASELVSMSSDCMITKISYLDPVTKKYKSFIPALHKAGSTNDFAITQGRAYFVWSDEAESLIVA